MARPRALTRGALPVGSRFAPASQEAKIEFASIDVDRLRAHCRERLSAYKVPDQVHVVEEIPRTGSGKIMRFRLRDLVDKAG